MINRYECEVVTGSFVFKVNVLAENFVPVEKLAKVKAMTILKQTHGIVKDFNEFKVVKIKRMGQ